MERSLTINGGAQVPAGGGDIDLVCTTQTTGKQVTDAQMMITRIDGFF